MMEKGLQAQTACIHCLGPWMGYFNLLSLSFLICHVMEIIGSFTSQGLGEDDQVRSPMLLPGM